MSRSDALHDRVQDAIREPGVLTGDGFVGLARALFAHQFDGCAPYAGYCRGRGVEPSETLALADIPAVPTDVFKRVDLCTFAPVDASVVFLTSGTTVGTRGRHLLRRTDTYAASIGPGLDRFLGLDGRIPVHVLGPPVSADPNSSLGWMLQWAVDHRGGPGSAFHWTAEGPDVSGFLAAVGDSSGPIAVLATARALQAVVEQGAATSLPTGSVIMETGGFKGATRSLPRVEFYRRVRAFFGLPDHALVSEYGMTELASQGYHPSFAEGRLRGGVDEDAPLVFPPWCRVAAVDPETLAVLPRGTQGLLRFWDLANVDSILAVQTADIGVVTADGVWLEGRARGATPRGCSLAIDELLRGAS